MIREDYTPGGKICIAAEATKCECERCAADEREWQQAVNWFDEWDGEGDEVDDAEIGGEA